MKVDRTKYFSTLLRCMQSRKLTSCRIQFALKVVQHIKKKVHFSEANRVFSETVDWKIMKKRSDIISILERCVRKEKIVVQIELIQNSKS